MSQASSAQTDGPPDPKQQAKQLVARKALALVESGMIVGLGSGSTASLFIQALGEELRTGRLKDIVGVPTSADSEKLARAGHIPVDDFSKAATCDITIDGADEVTPALDVIKGLGGALLREKLVAQNSKRLIIIVDESKTVTTLGTKSPLPVEVTTFGLPASELFLKSLGATPKLRLGKDGKPFLTDNHNVILDCHFEKGIVDPSALSQQLASRAGIVEHGMFLGMVRSVLIANSDGSVRQVDRPADSVGPGPYTASDGLFRRPH